MIGYWHTVSPPDAAAMVALGAHVGGHILLVERCRGEVCWQWMVLSSLGHEIEGGTAPDAHRAEVAAEEAAFHIHPPTEGDWIARLI